MTKPVIVELIHVNPDLDAGATWDEFDTYHLVFPLTIEDYSISGDDDEAEITFLNVEELEAWLQANSIPYTMHSVTVHVPL